MELQKEYYNLQKLYGIDWITKLLGDYRSYKYLRDTYTYKDINNEIYNNCNNM